MTFLVYIPGLMLFESFSRGLACHSNIQTFQHSVKLRIGRSEFPVLGKHAFIVQQHKPGILIVPRI